MLAGPPSHPGGTLVTRWRSAGTAPRARRCDQPVDEPGVRSPVVDLETPPTAAPAVAPAPFALLPGAPTFVPWVVRDGQHEGEVAEEEILVAVSALREAADRLLDARPGVAGVAGAAGAVQAALGGVAAAVPMAVLTTDRYGVVSTANAAAGHLVGTSSPRLRGKPLQVFVPPDQRRAVRRAVAQAWRTGLSRCRVPLVPRSGEPVEVDAVVVATGSTADGTTGLQWVLAPRGAADALAPESSDDAVVALAELCRLRPGATDMQPLLGRVAALVARAVPAADHASITLGDPLAPTVTAAGSETAQRLEGLQVIRATGPTVEAWSRGAAVTSEDLASEQRWSGFTAAALAEGPTTLAAVPVRSGAEVVGVITLYGTARGGGPSSGTSLGRAEVFATAVAALVEQDRHVAELRATVEQLQTALGSRAAIEQAKGMVAAWLGCGVDQAFSVLSRWSQDRNVKLREVAAFVVGAPEQARPLVLSRPAA